MHKEPLAAVTMVYNEPDLLPVWLRHYARQVGPEHCYVIDHGSTEGMGALAAFPGVRVARLPRTPLDEFWRCNTVSHFCNQLLAQYAYVAYSDVDELIVADPRRAPDLSTLCATGTAEVVTTLGMDVLQVESETPIDFGLPISAQRHWARASWSLCKPALIRRPVVWGQGFHNADHVSVFDGLYLFHLAYADFGLIKRRQRKRVRSPRVPGHSEHHGIPVEEMLWHIRNDYLSLPRIPEPTLGGPPETAFIQRLMSPGRDWCGGRLIGADIQADTLWQIPGAFAGKF